MSSETHQLSTRAARRLERYLAMLGISQDAPINADDAPVTLPRTVERFWHESPAALRTELGALADRAAIEGLSIEAEWLRAHAAGYGMREATLGMAPPRDYVMADLLAMSGAPGTLLRDYLDSATRENLVPKHRATSPGRSLARR